MQVFELQVNSRCCGMNITLRKHSPNSSSFPLFFYFLTSPLLFPIFPLPPFIICPSSWFSLFLHLPPLFLIQNQLTFWLLPYLIFPSSRLIPSFVCLFFPLSLFPFPFHLHSTCVFPLPSFISLPLSLFVLPSPSLLCLSPESAILLPKLMPR